MKVETNKEALNRLYNEVGLTEDEVYVADNKEFALITKNGIEKIRRHFNITTSLEPIQTGNPNCALVLAKGYMPEEKDGDKQVIRCESLGEASPLNMSKRINFPWAIAEKRAKARVVLELAKLYGYFRGEEELAQVEEERGKGKTLVENMEDILGKDV